MNKLTYRSSSGQTVELEVPDENTERLLDHLAKHFCRPTPEEDRRCDAILKRCVEEEKRRRAPR